MNTFALVLLLLSGSGRYNVIAIDGFQAQSQCQDFQSEWFKDFIGFRADDENYFIISWECSRLYNGV